MPFRSPRERLIQTLAFEAGGILIATPIYAALSGKGSADSVAVILALSAAVLVWTPLFNHLYDRIEWQRTGRLASDRPPAPRVLHALLQEAGALVLTLPILMILGGHTFAQAVLADIGLTLLYAIYAFVFYRIFDWLRPMQPLADTGDFDAPPPHNRTIRHSPDAGRL